MCEALGIGDLNHHDALSDARAAARVLMAMCESTSKSVIEVCETLGYRIGLLSSHRYAPFSNATGTRISDIKPTVDEIDPDGQLFGKRIAFTGTLDSMTRNAAFQATVNSGGEPSTSVSKRTHFLVIGMTDYTKVGADGMSSKLRKAMELNESGSAIEIINENDFLRMADPAAFSHDSD